MRRACNNRYHTHNHRVDTSIITENNGVCPSVTNHHNHLFEYDGLSHQGEVQQICNHQSRKRMRRQEEMYPSYIQKNQVSQSMK